MSYVREKYLRIVEKGTFGAVPARHAVPSDLVKKLRAVLETRARDEKSSAKKYREIVRELERAGLERPAKAVEVIAETEDIHAEMLQELADQISTYLW